MSFWSAVVLMVLIASAAKVLNARYEAMNRTNAVDAGSAPDSLEREAEKKELHQLRERVKVLETIATDPARRTAEEIEKLRD